MSRGRSHGRELLEVLAGFVLVARSQIAFGQTDQQFTARGAGKFVEVRRLDFVYFFKVRQALRQELSGWVAGRHEPGGPQQARASRDQHADTIGSEGNGVVHFLEAAAVERQSLVDVAFLERLSAQKK